MFIDNLSTAGVKLVDLYLRVLLAIDGEIADQEIPRTKEV